MTFFSNARRATLNICRAPASRRMAAALATAAAALSLALPAQANLVVNGDFEQTTNGAGQLGFNTNAVGWSVSRGSYNFLFSANTVDSTGATGQYGNVQLWGPHNGSANGMPGASPTGGNFAAADGAFGVGPIQQTINGLTAGRIYDVGFWWAAGQQKNFNGATTEQWKVSLGNQTQATAVLAVPNHGFSGWRHEVFSFTAASASELLSFLSVGTPTGVPPFALLDGVTVDEAGHIPEPAGLALVGLGLVGLGLMRRKQAVAA